MIYAFTSKSILDISKDAKLKNLGLNVLKPLRYAEQRRTLSNMDRNLYARMDGTKWTDEVSGTY